MSDNLKQKFKDAGEVKLRRVSFLCNRENSLDDHCLMVKIAGIDKNVVSKDVFTFDNDTGENWSEFIVTEEGLSSFKSEIERRDEMRGLFDTAPKNSSWISRLKDSLHL